MTIVEAARGCDRWRRHSPRRPCRCRPGPARSTSRHRTLRDRSGRLQGAACLAGELRAVTKVGVEGTGSYGAGLARFLRRADLEVIEVDRPNRAERRRTGKSDPLDAVEAARAALGGRAKSISKSKDGAVEAIGSSSWPSARLEGPGEGPDPDAPSGDHRARPAALSPKGLDCERTGQRGGPTAAVALGRSGDGRPQGGAVLVGPRIQGLEDEIAELDERIEALLKNAAPELLARFGSGPTPRPPLGQCRRQPRAPPLRSRLGPSCGVAPIPASSGKSTRHRLDRGVIARPTARCGASSWSASRTTLRPPPTSSAK